MSFRLLQLALSALHDSLAKNDEGA